MAEDSTEKTALIINSTNGNGLFYNSAALDSLPPPPVIKQETYLDLKLFKAPLSLFNVVLMGFIFMLLFTAFSPAQNLQSTVNAGNNVGVYGLGALYITFSLSNFVAPTIAFALGERLAMAAGGVGYVLFVAANILDHSASYFLPLFILGSMANGIGAAILWTAQGSYITKNSTDATIGRNNGLFFGIFQASQVIGNLVAALALPAKEHGKPPPNVEKPAQILFIAFASIATLAVLLFPILRPPPERPEDKFKPRHTVLQRFVGIFKKFIHPSFLMMICFMVYSGLSQAYFAGNFTRLLNDSRKVGFVMTAFGGSDVLASFAVGKILDKLGRKVVLFGSAFFILVTTGIICLVPEEYFAAHIWLSILCGIFAGISDAGTNTLLTATVGAVFEDDVENGFGAFKFIQASTSAINYVLALDIYGATLMLDLFLIVGCALFFFVDELHPQKKAEEDV